jgi:hypothetical protein
MSNTGSAGCQLEDVRKQYRDSVMPVPNYNREYGESFEEHFASEFGPEVASVVLDGNQLIGPVKQLLVAQARESAQHRQDLVEGLELEERSMRRSKTTLEHVDTFLAENGPTSLEKASVPDLVAIDEEILDWRSRAESLLQTRQQEIQTVNRRTGSPSKTLIQEYLYAAADLPFPVLRSGLDYIALG